MAIGGELASILKDIDYSSKKELLEVLRNLREAINTYPNEQKKIIKPLLVIAIQQAFYESEFELMRYKKYCQNRSAYEREAN